MSSSRSRMPERRAHEAFDFEHGGFRYKAGVGFYGDCRIGEVFLDVDKAGTAIQTHARDAAVVLSLLLQHGCPLDVIQRAVTRLPDGKAAGPIGTLLDLLAKREITQS